MKMNSLQKRVCRAGALAGVCLLGLTGCNTMTPPVAPYTAYTPREKIHLSVAVNVTDQLSHSKWEKDIPAGQAFANDAPILAKQTFTDVVEMKNGAPPQTPVDAILTPKLVYAGETSGATAFGKRIVSVKLEWTLNDPKGEPIWVDTFTGEASGSTGGADRSDLLKAAVESALNRSQRALWMSKAVREYARKKYSDVAIVEDPSLKITRPEVRKLCDTLQSSDEDEVMDALKALRKMDAPEAVPEILPCLQNSSPNVVRDACRTLAVLGNQSTVQYIEPLLNAKRSDVRKDAQNAITKLNAKS